MTLHEKIQALLAKAESTTHEGERDAYNAKAEALMLKYGIEQAELQATGQKQAEDIVQETLDYRGDYAVVMGQFVNTVASAVGNITVLQSRWKSQNRVYIIGHESDVRHCLTLVNSLVLQAQTACKRWWKTAPERTTLTPWEGYLERRSFLTSFAAGAGVRIRMERRDVEKTASKGAELVLVGKQAKVDAWVEQNHKVGKKSGSLRAGSAGQGAGHEAGKRADIGTKRVGGNRTQINR